MGLLRYGLWKVRKLIVDFLEENFSGTLEGVKIATRRFN